MIISKIHTIAFYTFKEIFKSKILLNVFFAGLALMVVTYVATSFTYGVPERVALDFGLGMLSISTQAISMFLGVSLLSKELESRTVYMVVSRPVPRYAFILGKLVGLTSIQVLNVAILSSMTLLMTTLMGGEISSLIFWVIFLTLLESVLLLLLVVLMSLIVNNILAVLFSVLILIAGHAVESTRDISFVKRTPVFQAMLDFYHYVLPGFYKLNLKDFVLYNKTLPFTYLSSATVYGIAYSVALLLLIIAIFNRKNLD